MRKVRKNTGKLYINLGAIEKVEHHRNLTTRFVPLRATAHDSRRKRGVTQSSRYRNVTFRTPHSKVDYIQFNVDKLLTLLCNNQH